MSDRERNSGTKQKCTAKKSLVWWIYFYSGSGGERAGSPLTNGQRGRVGEIEELFNGTTIVDEC